MELLSLLLFGLLQAGMLPPSHILYSASHTVLCITYYNLHLITYMNFCLKKCTNVLIWSTGVLIWSICTYQV